MKHLFVSRVIIAVVIAIDASQIVKSYVIQKTSKRVYNQGMLIENSSLYVYNSTFCLYVALISNIR